ncbi:MAG: alpha-hydroxy-acid oxidizing protein, partial [Candidatus Altarchaeaceae archaeon]
SGGIRNGVDAAKCFAIGADAVGMAAPFLREIYKDNNLLDEKKAEENLRKFLDKFILELKISLFLTGSKNVNEIKGKFSI